MSKQPTRLSKASISLDRVKELAGGRQIIFIGKHASNEAEDYFGGTNSLVDVILQLTVGDFSHCQTDNLPAGCACADVYLICTDGDMVRQARNVYDATLAEYYLKFALKDGALLLMLANHPRRHK